MTVGDKIKQRRIELNMSQDELAKKCGYKSRSSINKIEMSRDLPLKKVKLMASALDLPVSYLMDWEEEPQPEAFNVQKVIDAVGKSAMRAITYEEDELLKQFRELDGESKKQLMLMIKFFKDQQK